MNWLRAQEEVLPMVITIELDDGETLKLFDQTGPGVTVDKQIIDEFNKESRHLEEELSASKELFAEMGIEVERQEETLNQIETKVTETAKNVEQAVYELYMAEREKAKNTRLKCTLWGSGTVGAIGGVGGAGIGFALGSTTLVGGPVGGVAGGAAGLSSGAAVGGLLGNWVGRVLEAQENRVIDGKLVALQTTENPKWIPDDFSNRCMECANLMGKRYVNPKHHCRLCGGLYCGECTKYRLDIKYPGVENPKRERICVRCKEDLLSIQEGKSSKLRGQAVVAHKNVEQT